MNNMILPGTYAGEGDGAEVIAGILAAPFRLL